MILDPDVADPDGTITCACGEVFTGASFTERMAAWQAHMDDSGPPAPPNERGCFGWPRACGHHDDLECLDAESSGGTVEMATE